MERLSALDAEFLHLEDDLSHMHIAGVCVFDDPAPSYGEVLGLLRSKLHEIPRYRQRVRTVPLDLGRPIFVDDPHFDLEYHVRHTALPAPGSDAEFYRLMGRLMSSQLDRKRPLWEVWLVEGLENDRWALVFKVHHCLVDGIAGVQLLTVLLDLYPDTPLPEPRPWEPEPEPSGAAKVLDAWSGLAHDVTATTRQLVGALRDPGRAGAAVSGTVKGLGHFLGNLTLTPRISTEGTIGPHRSWAHSAADLADVKAIGKTFGGTVNDVVLTAVTGGWRRLLLARGEIPDEATVRSLIPVSTRGSDGKGVPDNRVSAILYDLPVAEADPIARLQLVRDQMGERKASGMVEAGEVVTTLGNLAPPMIVSTVSRTAIHMMQRAPQRSVGTITTNVPGPQFPLYCLGREMIEYRPFVPIIHGIRVATAILSYNGRMYFGVTGDYSSVPDVDVLASGIVDELAELNSLTQ